MDRFQVAVSMACPVGAFGTFRTKWWYLICLQPRVCNEVIMRRQSRWLGLLIDFVIRNMVAVLFYSPIGEKLEFRDVCLSLDGCSDVLMGGQDKGSLGRVAILPDCLVRVHHESGCLKRCCSHLSKCFFQSLPISVIQLNCYTMAECNIMSW